MKIIAKFAYSQVYMIKYIVLGLSLLTTVACTGNGKKKERQTVNAAKVAEPLVDTSLLVLDTLMIDSFLVNKPAFKEFKEDFRTFYAARNFRYAWFDTKGIIEGAQHLAGQIRARESDGVLKKQAYADEFFTLIDQQKAKPLKPLLALELMLTAQYFSYSKNRLGGSELTKAKDLGWYLQAKKLSYAQLLAKQLKSPSSEIEQEAVIPQYIALRKMLNHYQELEKKEKDVWVASDTLFKKISVGDTAVALAKLRERLFQLGDLNIKTPDSVYDQPLADAIVRFKKRHGIRADFSISQSFLKEINVPLHSRIQQMMINLERMRWIPLGDHGAKFILVNIPAYQLYYYENNKLSWGCKVVVGKAMNQTVIFEGNLQYIVFSPYWYVPESIIKKEILPAMKNNPAYLDRHRMEWNDGKVRQKPGADNSLGLVKFIFPNVNDIYLHDTPSKPLFKEDVRAFSHGCIRVEKPKELAALLLPKWTSKNIDAAMKGGKEQWIPLKNKVPVYIGYFTAYVDSAGELNFRDDIYQRDGRLLEMLMQ